jgi:sulfhydrogenase subunit gamma (sulfur reductase)
MNNPYLPYFAIIEDIKQETSGVRPIKTFTTALKDERAKDTFRQRPGQCAMVGITGVGESMISVCSSSDKTGYLQFSIMKVGKVTAALHDLEVGDMITIRGPYGKPFPVDDWKGRNILTIGGGIGQASLRPIVNYVLDKRQDYKSLEIIYGARSPSELIYLDELKDLKKGDAAKVYLTVDREAKGWKGHVGLVPQYLLELKPSPENTIAITCGPPIMIKFVLEGLVRLGFGGDDIYTTLENRMKCGIGKCGKCNVGSVYVCKDGPVFSYSQLKTFLPDML